MVAFTTIPEARASYEHWLARQPLSTHTRRTYLTQVNRYCTYLSTFSWELVIPSGSHTHAITRCVITKRPSRSFTSPNPVPSILPWQLSIISTAFLNCLLLRWRAKTCPRRLLAP